MSLNLFFELVASALYGVGMLTGSTTLIGSAVFLVAQIFWWLICFRRRMWGIIPVNLLMTLTSAVNLWRALQ